MISRTAISLKHEQADECDSLSCARRILKNMGVSLPNGDISEVHDTLKSDDYMGWRSCTMQERHQDADEGIPAIGIRESYMVILQNMDDPLSEAAVMSINDATPTRAVAYMRYYSYRG